MSLLQESVARIATVDKKLNPVKTVKTGPPPGVVCLCVGPTLLESWHISDEQKEYFK